MAANFEPFNTLWHTTSFWWIFCSCRRFCKANCVSKRVTKKCEPKVWQCFLKRRIYKRFIYVAMSSTLDNGRQCFGVLWKHRVPNCMDFFQESSRTNKTVSIWIRIFFILTVKLFNMTDAPFRYRQCFWQFVWFITKAHNYFCYAI